MNKDEINDVEKEIEDLHKTIKKMQKEIKDAEFKKDTSKICIGAILSLSLLVGWIIGKLAGNATILTSLFGFLGTVASHTFIKQISDSKEIIKHANDKIDMCQGEIDDLHIALVESKTKGAKKTPSQSSEKKYEYSHERSKADDEFSRYVDKLKEEGFFEGIDKEHKKR